MSGQAYSHQMCKIIPNFDFTRLMVELSGVLNIASHLATHTMALYGAISVLVAMIFRQMNTSEMNLIAMSLVLVI